MSMVLVILKLKMFAGTFGKYCSLGLSNSNGILGVIYFSGWMLKYNIHVVDLYHWGVFYFFDF